MGNTFISLAFLSLLKKKTSVSEYGTGDELGFIVQHKVNWVLEYLFNDDENFRKLSL